MVPLADQTGLENRQYSWLMPELTFIIEPSLLTILMALVKPEEPALWMKSCPTRNKTHDLNERFSSCKERRSAETV